MENKKRKFFKGIKKKAIEEHQWASKIVKVEGGYMCFESVQDWRAWKAAGAKA